MNRTAGAGKLALAFGSDPMRQLTDKVPQMLASDAALLLSEGLGHRGRSAGSSPGRPPCAALRAAGRALQPRTTSGTAYAAHAWSASASHAAAAKKRRAIARMLFAIMPSSAR